MLTLPVTVIVARTTQQALNFYRGVFLALCQGHFYTKLGVVFYCPGGSLFAQSEAVFPVFLPHSLPVMLDSSDWIPWRSIWVGSGFAGVFLYTSVWTKSSLLLDRPSARHQLVNSTTWDRTLLWAVGRYWVLHEG